MKFGGVERWILKLYQVLWHVMGPRALFHALAESGVIAELDMSWTSLKLSTELAPLFNIRTLKKLNLSNNALPSASARVIGKNLHLSRGLDLLDLSFNPFTPSDALFLLSKMKLSKVRVKELRLDNIPVSTEFPAELKEILKLKFRRNTVVTYGHVLRNYNLPEKDIKIIVMKRLVRITHRKSKNALDVLMYLLEYNRTQKYLDLAEFNRCMRTNETPLKDEFVEQMYRSFQGIKNDAGGKFANLDVMVDYIHRLWPDKKLPPTPPPTPPSPPGTRRTKKKLHKGKKVKTNENYRFSVIDGINVVLGFVCPITITVKSFMSNLFNTSKPRRTPFHHQMASFVTNECKTVEIGSCDLEL
ncbi:unnamed protein product [Spodoptera littoralis]|uniref:Uncharacterized protein n=1 Tax=Spodoptera littoralis TaxID=7109 RepID=A0A9P0IDV6_SPOLI|nr:unnamed protein product [Spodoptera littoralis]CAH1644096.1 unnamed protein product [Spodoptera littoralis]